MFFEQGDGVDPVFGREYVHAVTLQQAAGDFAHRDRIVHDQHQQRALFQRVVEHQRGVDRPGRQGRLPGTDVREQIDDQHHAAIAQNGRPGQPLHARKLRPQALDDDLSRTGHGIHMHRHAPFVALHQQHRHRLVLAQQFRPGDGVQQVTQVEQLVALAGVFITRRVLLIVPRQLVGQDAHQAFNGVERNRVLIVRALHHQCAVDRHRKRQANAKVHALARPRINHHRATKLAHFFVHHVHAHAPPGNLRDLFRRGEPRLQDELQYVAVAHLLMRAEQPPLDCLAPHRLQWHPGAVVAHVEDDIAAFVGQVQADAAPRRLTGQQPCLARFLAMVHGIAQHMFQRRHHAFQHVAVHLAFGIADHKLDVLAQLFRHLAHDALEARQHAFKRHHARAHQAFLQLGVDARLLLQQVVRILVAAVQRFLEVQQVGGRLGERARQLLQLRMAVHFQRVKFFITQALGLGLLAAEDAALGFGVETAQLVAHAFNGGFDFIERGARIVDLLLDTATEDRGFTGQVDQVIQQIGGDFHHVRRRVDRRFRLARRQCHRQHRLITRVHQAFDALDELVHRTDRQAVRHRIDHLRQAVMAALQQREEFRRRGQQTGGQPFVEKLQLMGQIANRPDLDHARAPFEGVQVAQQGFHLLAIVRLGLPAQQRAA